MAASKSIASAQLVEEAAAIVLVHRHQCQSTCWSTLKALGRPNAAVCLLAVPVDALCCWCDCCACAAAKPLPEPRDVLIRHAGRCRMQGGAVGIGRAGRGRTECRHWIGIEDRGFGMYVCMATPSSPRLQAVVGPPRRVAAYLFTGVSFEQKLPARGAPSRTDAGPDAGSQGAEALPRPTSTSTEQHKPGRRACTCPEQLMCPRRKLLSEA